MGAGHNLSLFIEDNCHRNQMNFASVTGRTKSAMQLGEVFREPGLCLMLQHMSRVLLLNLHLRSEGVILSSERGCTTPEHVNNSGTSSDHPACSVADAPCRSSQYGVHRLSHHLARVVQVPAQCPGFRVPNF